MKIKNRIQSYVVICMVLISNCSLSLLVIDIIDPFPYSESWDIAEGVSNKYMLERVWIKRELRYFVPYLINKSEYNQIEKVNKEFGEIIEKSISKISECKYEYHFLVENYGKRYAKTTSEVGFSLKGSELYKYSSYSILYYFTNSFHYTNPLGFDLFLNPLRAEKLNFGKNMFNYNSETDVKVDRVLLIFCSHEKIDDLEFHIYLNSDLNHFSNYSINSEASTTQMKSGQ